MNRAVKRLHTWAGLLTFVNLVVYGITGVSATLGGSREAPLVSTRDVAFTVAGNLSDRESAEAICRQLGLTLALPVSDFALQRDPANRLLLDLWHANGHHRVTVFEAEHRLHIEEYRVGLGRYLDVLHMTSGVFRSGDWRMTAWSRYNEFAMWSLVAMLVSGVYLWLASRPGHRWATAMLAVGAVLFAAAYAWVR